MCKMTIKKYLQFMTENPDPKSGKKRNRRRRAIAQKLAEKHPTFKIGGVS